MNRRSFSVPVLMSLAFLFCLTLACSAPIAKYKSTIQSRLSHQTEDAHFLFTLESTMLDNGFTIHERSIDSLGYRYIVTWVIPTARQQFWQRQYKMRFAGDVLAARATDGWLIEGRFGTYDDQHTASIQKDFQSCVVDPVVAQLAKGH